MRRKPKENNFKAVLETIRHLMNTECVVPAWLHDILLGYGDPSAAHYSKLPNQVSKIKCNPLIIECLYKMLFFIIFQERNLDFNDTFLSYDHIVESFPDYTVKCEAPEVERNAPYRLIFEDVVEKNESEETTENTQEPQISKSIIVQPYKLEERGPYLGNRPKQ